MDFAVCFFCSLISWRELEAFSFKLFYFYQDLLKKEGITNWNTGTNFSDPSCQDLAVWELNYWPSIVLSDLYVLIVPIHYLETDAYLTSDLRNDKLED